MEQSAEQFWRKFSPIEFRVKKSLSFRVDYISQIIIKIETLKN